MLESALPRNASAPARASRSRSSSELNTTQSTWSLDFASSSLSTVPPQPISMSSQCAPRQRIRVTGSAEGDRRLNMSAVYETSSTALDRALELARLHVRLPDLPAAVARLEHLLQLLLILERVHRRPEALVLVRQQQALARESLERLL